jgi:hypothetical protein
MQGRVPAFKFPRKLIFEWMLIIRNNTAVTCKSRWFEESPPSPQWYMHPATSELPLIESQLSQDEPIDEQIGLVSQDRLGACKLFEVRRH